MAGPASQWPLRMKLYWWLLSGFFPAELNPTCFHEKAEKALLLAPRPPLSRRGTQASHLSSGPPSLITEIRLQVLQVDLRVERDKI